MVMLLPQPDGHTLCAAFNRGEGMFTWHHADRLQKPQPWLARVPTARLCDAAGAQAICAVLAMQSPSVDHTIDDFYAAMQSLVKTCDGALLVAGTPQVQALYLPGQTPQKANECTISGTFAAMYFCLQVYTGVWQTPAASDVATAHARYRVMKQACRKVILEQVLGERQAAIARQDVAYVATLTDSLRQVAGFLRDRLPRRGDLQPLYDMLPSDVTYQPICF